MSAERGENGMKMQRWLRRIVCLLLLCLLPLFGEIQTAAAADTGDLSYYEQLREQNAGQKAEHLRFIPTTKQAVIYTFGGLSRAGSVEDILQRLADNNMRGTFFVTERELQRNADTIAKIASSGQELAIGLRYTEEAGYADYCAQIDRIRSALRDRFGADSSVVRQMSGPLDAPELQEAVSAMGCMLLGQGLNVVQSKHKEAAAVSDVMPAIFGKWTTALGRGEIVYIRTDFYTNPTLAGDMMLAVKEEKIDNVAYRSYDDSPETNPQNDSAYTVAAVGDVLADTEKLYTYPIPDLSVLPKELQPSYHAFTINENNFDQEFFKRYIGAPLVDESDRMLGFSSREMKQADKSGIVKTVTDSTVFLTFDDWGNDDSINKLLYVLRKHQVPATFFIITWNMPNNPNLLRAIAADGHEIGSHTNGHKAMAVRDAKDHQVPVMKDADYAADVTTAYEKLAGTVGDVVVDGRYSLTRLMRPPTLAVSRSGAKAILEAGYTFMVSGYASTEDYEAPTVQSLVGAMQEGIYTARGEVRQGSIIVMHMSGQANKTARALDLLLTANEQRSENDPRKFKVGRLADYLNEGYSQMLKSKQEEK